MIYTFLLCGLEMPTFCMEKFFIKKELVRQFTNLTITYGGYILPFCVFAP